MLYNKNRFQKANDKKVLHKVKKQWVTISLAILMAIGGGAAATQVNASVNNSTGQNALASRIQRGTNQQGDNHAPGEVKTDVNNEVNVQMSPASQHRILKAETQTTETGNRTDPIALDQSSVSNDVSQVSNDSSSVNSNSNAANNASSSVNSYSSGINSLSNSAKNFNNSSANNKFGSLSNVISSASSVVQSNISSMSNALNEISNASSDVSKQSSFAMNFSKNNSSSISNVVNSANYDSSLANTASSSALTTENNINLADTSASSAYQDASSLTQSLSNSVMIQSTSERASMENNQASGDAVDASQRVSDFNSASNVISSGTSVINSLSKWLQDVYANSSADGNLGTDSSTANSLSTFIATNSSSINQLLGDIQSDSSSVGSFNGKVNSDVKASNSDLSSDASSVGYYNNLASSALYGNDPNHDQYSALASLVDIAQIDANSMANIQSNVDSISANLKSNAGKSKPTSVQAIMSNAAATSSNASRLDLLNNRVAQSGKSLSTSNEDLTLLYIQIDNTSKNIVSNEISDARSQYSNYQNESSSIIKILSSIPASLVAGASSAANQAEHTNNSQSILSYQNTANSDSLTVSSALSTASIVADSADSDFQQFQNDFTNVSSVVSQTINSNQILDSANNSAFSATIRADSASRQISKDSSSVIQSAGQIKKYNNASANSLLNSYINQINSANQTASNAVTSASNASGSASSEILQESQAIVSEFADQNNSTGESRDKSNSSQASQFANSDAQIASSAASVGSVAATNANQTSVNVDKLLQSLSRNAINNNAIKYATQASNAFTSAGSAARQAGSANVLASSAYTSASVKNDSVMSDSKSASTYNNTSADQQFNKLVNDASQALSNAKSQSTSANNAYQSAGSYAVAASQAASSAQSVILVNNVAIASSEAGKASSANNSAKTQAVAGSKAASSARLLASQISNDYQSAQSLLNSLRMNKANNNPASASSNASVANKSAASASSQAASAANRVSKDSSAIHSVSGAIQQYSNSSANQAVNSYSKDTSNQQSVANRASSQASSAASLASAVLSVANSTSSFAASVSSSKDKNQAGSVISAVALASLDASAAGSVAQVASSAAAQGSLAAVQANNDLSLADKIDSSLNGLAIPTESNVLVPANVNSNDINRAIVNLKADEEPAIITFNGIKDFNNPNVDSENDSHGSLDSSVSYVINVRRSSYSNRSNGDPILDESVRLANGDDATLCIDSHRNLYAIDNKYHNNVINDFKNNQPLSHNREWNRPVYPRIRFMYDNGDGQLVPDNDFEGLNINKDDLNSDGTLTNPQTIDGHFDEPHPIDAVYALDRNNFYWPFVPYTNSYYSHQLSDPYNMHPYLLGASHRLNDLIPVLGKGDGNNNDDGSYWLDSNRVLTLVARRHYAHISYYYNGKPIFDDKNNNVAGFKGDTVDLYKGFNKYSGHGIDPNLEVAPGQSAQLDGTSTEDNPQQIPVKLEDKSHINVTLPIELMPFSNRNDVNWDQHIYNATITIYNTKYDQNNKYLIQRSTINADPKDNGNGVKYPLDSNNGNVLVSMGQLDSISGPNNYSDWTDLNNSLASYQDYNPDVKGNNLSYVGSYRRSDGQIVPVIYYQPLKQGDLPEDLIEIPNVNYTHRSWEPLNYTKDGESQYDRQFVNTGSSYINTRDLNYDPNNLKPNSNWSQGGNLSDTPYNARNFSSWTDHLTDMSGDYAPSGLIVQLLPWSSASNDFKAEDPSDSNNDWYVQFTKQDNSGNDSATPQLLKGDGNGHLYVNNSSGSNKYVKYLGIADGNSNNLGVSENVQPTSNGDYPNVKVTYNNVSYTYPKNATILWDPNDRRFCPYINGKYYYGEVDNFDNNTENDPTSNSVFNNNDVINFVTKGNLYGSGNQYYLGDMNQYAQPMNYTVKYRNSNNYLYNQNGLINEVNGYVQNDPGNNDIPLGSGYSQSTKTFDGIAQGSNDPNYVEEGDPSRAYAGDHLYYDKNSQQFYLQHDGHSDQIPLLLLPKYTGPSDVDHTLLVDPAYEYDYLNHLLSAEKQTDVYLHTPAYVTDNSKNPEWTLGIYNPSSEIWPDDNVNLANYWNNNRADTVKDAVVYLAKQQVRGANDIYFLDMDNAHLINIALKNGQNTDDEIYSLFSQNTNGKGMDLNIPDFLQNDVSYDNDGQNSRESNFHKVRGDSSWKLNNVKVNGKVMNIYIIRKDPPVNPKSDIINNTRIYVSTTDLNNSKYNGTLPLPISINYVDQNGDSIDNGTHDFKVRGYMHANTVDQAINNQIQPKQSSDVVGNQSGKRLWDYKDHYQEIGVLPAPITSGEDYQDKPSFSRDHLTDDANNYYLKNDSMIFGDTPAVTIVLQKIQSDEKVSYNHKTITENIRYHVKGDDSKDPQESSQKVTFEQPVITNSTGKKVSTGAWTLDGNPLQNVTSPNVPGYTVEQPVIQAPSDAINQPDQHVYNFDVYYDKQIMPVNQPAVPTTITIHYVDQDGQPIDNRAYDFQVGGYSHTNTIDQAINNQIQPEQKGDRVGNFSGKQLWNYVKDYYQEVGVLPATVIPGEDYQNQPSFEKSSLNNDADDYYLKTDQIFGNTPVVTIVLKKPQTIYNHKTVYETVNYHVKGDDSKDPKSSQQAVTFKQQIIKNGAGKVVVTGKWISDHQLQNVTSPNVSGYTPDKGVVTAPNDAADRNDGYGYVFNVVYDKTAHKNSNQPNHPNKPSRPNEPDHPAQPSHPVNPQPDQPINPAKPNRPVKPNHPNEPNRPVNPIKPDQPSKPINPVIPNQPVNPNIPTNPDEPINPNIPAQPNQPTNPVTPNQPVGPNKPDHPAQPSHPVDPQPDQPINPAKPNRPAKPSQPSKPTNPDQPVKPNTPTNPNYPNEPNRPTNPVKPDQPSKPATPAKPQPNQPSRPTNPINPTNPVNPKPDQPSQPSKPVTPQLTTPTNPVGPLSPNNNASNNSGHQSHGSSVAHNSANANHNNDDNNNNLNLFNNSADSKSARYANDAKHDSLNLPDANQHRHDQHQVTKHNDQKPNRASAKRAQQSKHASCLSPDQNRRHSVAKRSRSAKQRHLTQHRTDIKSDRQRTAKQNRKSNRHVNMRQHQQTRRSRHSLWNKARQVIRRRIARHVTRHSSRTDYRTQVRRRTPTGNRYGSRILSDSNRLQKMIRHEAKMLGMSSSKLERLRKTNYRRYRQLLEAHASALFDQENGNQSRRSGRQYVHGIDDARQGKSFHNYSRDYAAGYNAFQQVTGRRTGHNDRSQNGKLPQTSDGSQMTLAAAVIMILSFFLRASAAVDKHRKH